MKKQAPTSIDGFIPRRPSAQLGDLHQGEREKPIDRSLHTGDKTRQTVGVPRDTNLLGRVDIDESLREIDDPELDGKKPSRRQRRKDREDRNDRPKSKTKRIITIVAIVLLVAGLAVAGYFIHKAISAGESVFKGSILDLVQSQPLKEDENGRSNFLIVGTSEDDPGHQGANLTDSILILSVNQKTKDAYTFSIPRDLQVEFGMPCVEGYSGKINGYFSCVNEDDTDAAEQERLTSTQKFIGEIVGLDIQYGVHVNYSVMRDVVNAIGGNITVNIESRNPNGQMDSNFDWKCGPNIAKRKTVCPPSGHFIDYPNGPAVLDAEHALYLAQARGDAAPTYGFEQSNFDRERNQQKIILAIREKALSAGTLTNLGAVTGLIDAMGANLRTNIETKEIRTLMKLAQDIPSEKINSIDLHKEGEAIFSAAAQPVAGKFQYDDLRAYILKNLTASALIKEDPHVTVLNGGAGAGMGQSEADKLIAAGFSVDTVDNAPEGTYPKYTVYQLDKTKTASADKLKQLYNVTFKTTTPSMSVTGDTDFLIIIGPAQ